MAERVVIIPHEVLGLSYDVNALLEGVFCDANNQDICSQGVYRVCLPLSIICMSRDKDCFINLMLAFVAIIKVHLIVLKRKCILLFPVTWVSYVKVGNFCNTQHVCNLINWYFHQLPSSVSIPYQSVCLLGSLWWWVFQNKNVGDF